VDRDATGRLLASVVEVRLLARATREPETRAALRRVEWRLRPLLGVGVPKRQAAAQLGVSVVALDKWIARGRLPVVGRRGSARRSVETRALLEVAEQVEALRRAGVERGLLAHAFAALGWSDDPDGEQVVREEIALLPRPNVSVQQLRADYERIPPGARVAHLTQLHRSLNALVRGRR
jgi:hypothetical protein